MSSYSKTGFDLYTDPVQNLIKRTITGIIAIILIIGSLIVHPYAFTIALLIIMLFGLHEFFHLAGNGDVYPQQTMALFNGTVMLILIALVALEFISPVFLIFLPLLIMFFFTAELFRNKPNVLQNLTVSLFPLIYITLPLSTVMFMLSPMITGNSPHWRLAFGFFAILWINDTFAYLTGSLMGKHKLFERISPKKTWEGTIGGILSGLLASYILSLFFNELSTWQWLAGALIITITGTLGDLSESLLKRKFNVKDSGNFFPGHGGVLDRIDSGLFSAPSFVFYLILLNL
jgi:phosphatidate cytidylyltransferase